SPVIGPAVEPDPHPAPHNYPSVSLLSASLGIASQTVKQQPHPVDRDTRDCVAPSISIAPPGALATPRSVGQDAKGAPGRCDQGRPLAKCTAPVGARTRTPTGKLSLE